MNPCQRCGADVGDENPPAAKSCSQCPPVSCADCGESDDRSCCCWISLEGMNLADLKAVFAPDFDLASEREGTT